MSATETRQGRQPRPLDEETIAAVRRRIGIPVRYSPRSHNEVSSTDSFRHFALAYGDDNPLYTDPEYAVASSWGAPIAPPLYPFTAGVTRRAEWSDAEKAEMAGGDPLAGLGQYMCGERWVFPKPIRAGDVLWTTQSLFSAELKPSSFGGGTGALVSHRVSWEDEAGTPFAFRFLDFWHADRDHSNRAAKNRDIPRPHYTDEDLERIDALYAAEAVRGATPRLVTDAEVGEELGPIAKGPMSVTEMVAWHAGVGWGMYGGGASKVSYKNRTRIPKFYLKNGLGFWDAAQSCHWDDERAQRMGHPAAYDYGVMRTNWMVHLVTNWMGDDAWIWKVSASVRKFNYLGDWHVVSGVVREVDRAAGTVTIDTRGVNQRGDSTCDGRIVVILPPAGGGHAVIPEYDPDDVPEASVP
jgi:acyl dehydratase